MKIGGGFGNVARTPCDSLRLPDTEYVEETSGYPRFCEGARYWLQWAGFPEAVYTPKNNTDDYKDDYMSRAHWVNALMGGSERLPDSAGLRIPVDMALAFHSDAGVRDGDGIVGRWASATPARTGGKFVGGRTATVRATSRTSCRRRSSKTSAARSNPTGSVAGCGTAPITKRVFRVFRRCCWNCFRTRISPTCVWAATRVSNSS